MIFSGVAVKTNGLGLALCSLMGSELIMTLVNDFGAGDTKSH
jgi:hypothetical protein